MRDSALQFLSSVLGIDGAQALARTAVREPALEPLLVPRAALAWLQDRADYEGLVPGQANSYVSFEKSTTGYRGLVSLGDTNYEFEAVTAEHLAAALALSVGVDLAARAPVRDVTLARLGKSIDVLAKAYELTKALPKALTGHYAGLQPARPEHVKPGTVFYSTLHTGERIPYTAGSEIRMMRVGGHHDEPHVYIKPVNKPLDSFNHGWYPLNALFVDAVHKTELPGQTAQPRAQQGPQEAQPPAKQPKMPKPKLPKAPKMPGLRVEKNELGAACAACGKQSFNAHQHFAGCLCFRDLAKHVKTTVYGDGVVLDFGPAFPASALPLLRKALKS